MQTQNLDSSFLTFLDVETTGLSTWFGDRVCEIAILRCRGDEILDSLDTLVNPERPISPGAARVNGIKNEDLIGAPLFGGLVTRIQALLDDAIVIAHNASFDLGFISNEFARLGESFPSVDVIDTLQIARQHFHFVSNGLQAIADALEIERPTAHRAMADVMTTRAVLRHFLAQLDQVSIEQYSSTTVSPEADTLPPILPPLVQEALASKKDLLIRYVDQKGTETQRRITPKQILVLRDYIYVSAYCHLRNEDRSFRLDRITEIEIEAE